MNEERAKAAFNIRELTNLLDGGEKSTKVRRSIDFYIKNIDILKCFFV